MESADSIIITQFCRPENPVSRMCLSLQKELIHQRFQVIVYAGIVPANSDRAQKNKLVVHRIATNTQLHSPTMSTTNMVGKSREMSDAVRKRGFVHLSACIVDG